MKKTVVPLCVLLIMFSFSFSQNLSPNLLSSQGGVDRSENMILEWTLGESAIETITEQNKIYSQGFIQPYLETSYETILVNEKIIMFPNPVDQELNVKYLSEDDSEININFYNVNGILIKQFKSNFSLNKTLQLDVADLPSGVYFIRVSSATMLLKSHKIIKY